MAGQAFAADLPARIAAPAPVAPLYTWTGFYAGLNIGGAWGRSNATTGTDCSAIDVPPGYICSRLSITPAALANAALVTASGTGPMSAGGVTGGVQAGYNLQHGNFVYGVEADFGAFSLKGARQAAAGYLPGVTVGPPASFVIGSSFSTDWLLTVRGRLGLALPSEMLLYATGGLAVTELTVTNFFGDNFFPPPATVSESARASKVKAGFAIGGGLEKALGNHWSVKGEYLFVDFGKVTVAGFIASPGIGLGAYAQGLSTSADLTAHIARVGVNYRF